GAEVGRGFLHVEVDHRARIAGSVIGLRIVRRRASAGRVQLEGAGSQTAVVEQREMGAGIRIAWLLRAQVKGGRTAGVRVGVRGASRGGQASSTGTHLVAQNERAAGKRAGGVRGLSGKAG